MTAPERAPAERVLGGRYRLLDPIDRGGAAVVWRATDLRLGRDVAVKVLGREADDAFRERFQQEARRAAQVTHPNVVTVYDEGRDGDDAYMVMEHIRGRTVRDLIADQGPLPADQASRIVSQVAAALDAAHAAGVLHLDVKPANIIVSEHGVAKLADFGVAVAAHGEVERELVGTARYVAPERVLGAAPSPRSDVYGLGLVAYELIAGRSAFQGVENDDLLQRRLEGPAPSLRGARAGVTRELDAVVARALEREPGLRFATAGELAAAFQDATGRTDATSPLGAVTSARPMPEGRAFGAPRLDHTLAMLAVIVVLLAVVAIFLGASSASRAVPTSAPGSAAPPAAAGTTPNVVGMELREADRAARGAGYVGIAFAADQSLRGKPCSVQRQDPAANAPVRADTRLSVAFVPGKDCLND